MKDFRVGFCVSGAGRLFRAAACHAVALGIHPALVVAESKCAEDLEAFCAERKVPIHKLNPKPRAAFDSEITRLCVAAELDLLCLTFDRIVPPPLVAHYRGRIINVHMGLLPAFKGMGALAQAVRQGVRFAGATVHEVTEDVDAGAVVSQCVIALRRQESPESLGRRLFVWLRPMFLQVLAWYAVGRVIRQGGHLWVRDAVYGELPVSPAIEEPFPE